MPARDDASLVAASVSSAAAGYHVLLWMVLFGIGYLALYPFTRRIGGPEGGSEKAYVGAVWVIAAIVTAILMSR